MEDGERDPARYGAVVGIGEYGGRIAAELRCMWGLETDAIVIADRPGDWTVVPSIVVADPAAARQLGEDVAEFIAGRQLVFVVGDAEDALYAGVAPWIAGLAREFEAGAVEVVPVAGKGPTPCAASVALTVAVDDDDDGCAAIVSLFDATEGWPRLGVDGDVGGLADLGLGRTARFTHVHARRELDELAARAGRRLGPADAYLVMFAVSADPETSRERLDRAASILGQARARVLIGRGRVRHGTCVAAFAIAARGGGS